MLRSSFTVRPSIENPPESSPVNFDIHYPVCRKFIPRRNGSKFCYCNRSIRFHESQIDRRNPTESQLRKLQDEIWNKKIHTRSLQDEAFGQLQNDAFYVRVDPEISLTEIKDFLFQKWELPEPKLVMSIIGGTREFILDDWLERRFVNGIVDVAVRTDTWIITNGYNNGLVQLVGQAIHKIKIRDSEHKTVALAVCKWGGVKNIEQLIQRKETVSNQDTQSDSSDTDDDDDDVQVEVRKKKQYELNLDHTHYLMLDDGKYGNVNTEQYRTSLCNRIIKRKAKNHSHTSAVTIVVDGGDATISNIYHDLRANIPVVMIKGSGRVADFFDRWLTYTKDINHRSTEGRIYEIDELKNQTPGQQSSKKSSGVTETKVSPYEAIVDLDFRTLPDLFSEYQIQLEQDLKNLLISGDHLGVNEHSRTKYSSKITRLLDEVMFCLQPEIRSNITVFNLESENDLSQAIFQIIAQSYKRIWQEKKKNDDNAPCVDDLLALTMDWDCIDVAKEFALENTLKYVDDVSEFFLRALRDDLFTFVFEFIRLGYNPAEGFFPLEPFYKTEGRYKQFIEDLYSNKEIYEGKNELRHFIEGYVPSEQKPINTTDVLNETLRNLIGSYMHKLYFDSFVKEEADRNESGLNKKAIVQNRNNLQEQEHIISSGKKRRRNQMAHDYIMRDLFLWSILTNRVNTAKVFLSYMKYRICPALIATKVFKQYHKKAPHGELQDSYGESAEYFEQYAINCLDKCDDYDAERACKIVLQRNELYGYVTCLQVAADAKDRAFIAEPACVEAMNNIWFDKLHPNQARKRDKLALFVAFVTLGLLAPVFVLYREYEQGEVGEIPRKVLRSCGINYWDSYALEFPRRIKSQLTLNRFGYQVKNFHQSPLIKFGVHFIVYLFFLLLFSYVLLFQFNPPTATSPSIHWTEILVILLISCMLVEEIHYFFTQDYLKFSGKIIGYFTDLLKFIRFLAIFLFYIGLILRFTYAGSEEQFVAARIIMAIDIELWWLGSLSFIIVVEALGPQLVAIAYMLRDLLFFVCIIAVVMIGYGVASRSMVYYPLINGFTTESDGSINPSFDGRSVFRQVIAPVYFFLHGEFGNELDNLDTNRDAGWSIATHVIFAFHMLFVNILLTNLLIAMFSKRFEKVYDETRYIWHSQQYLFTREYYMRAPLCPPFSLIIDLYHLGRMLVFSLRRVCLKKPADPNATVFKMIPIDRKLIKEWCDSERASTYEYAQNEVRAVATKASIEKDSSSKENKDASNKENIDDMIDNEEDSAKIIEILRKVQENVRRLTATIDEQLAEAPRIRRRSTMGQLTVGRSANGQKS